MPGVMDSMGTVNESWPYMAYSDDGQVLHFQTQWGLTCFLGNEGNDYDGRIGVRISSIFVVLVVSTCVTFFPVLATRTERFRIPYYAYLFARYFGSGVIVATAFIHLLDPAYDEIGPASCVGMNPATGGYSWPPAIALGSGMLVFFMDFAADRYVEKKYGVSHEVNENPVAANMGRSGSVDAAMLRYSIGRRRSTVPHAEEGVAGEIGPGAAAARDLQAERKTAAETDELSENSEAKEKATEMSFQQQIAAFLILEFGVIFHSVIIGLTLGSAGAEFNTLYPVIVFHQSFEGLGIGARLSAIPFPRRLRWMPWVLCIAYGLTTPISIAIGIGVGTTYNATSYTASVVSGVLDSISSGILIYTGFVELLARDFIFNPERPDDSKQLWFMSVSVLLGAGIMALLGKWA